MFRSKIFRSDAKEMIIQVGKFLEKLKSKHDDDTIDRCNYLVTNTILIICAITVAAKQYVGEPLQCWVPAEFKGGWEQYIENYCFVENTYFVPVESDIPEELEERNDRQIHYYQWVPFILILQAALFMIPCTIWKTFNFRTGLDIAVLSQNACEIRKEWIKNKSEEKDGGKTINENDIAERIKYATEHCENFRTTTGKTGEKKHWQKTGQKNTFDLALFGQSYATRLYIFCKSLNVINIGIQFYLINHFLGASYTLWGIGILQDLWQGRTWSESGHFPRVTFCDVNIREIGNINRKTVQCVLMINMFNEKIFIIIWFWLLFLGFMTLLNLIYWIIISTVPRFSKEFIRTNLDGCGVKPTPEKFDKFFDLIISKDVMTTLRLINDNSGELVACEVVHCLWNLMEPKPSKSRDKATQNELPDEKTGDPQEKAKQTDLQYQDLDDRSTGESKAN